MIYLDTHIMVWLAAGLFDKLSDAASAAIEAAEVLMYSPVVRLELKYLEEIGRITTPSQRVIKTLEDRLGVKEATVDLGPVITVAESLFWTRDPFDRLIVAHAHLINSPLITKDETIRANYIQAIW